MRALTVRQMLAIWEDGQTLPPLRRALLLLERAFPDETPTALAALPVGERDARLLDLREQTFGPNLSSLATCPGCGEKLELNFTVADIRMPAPAASADLVFAHGGYTFRFNLPRSVDLEDLTPDAAGRMCLLRRCAGAVEQDGRAVPVDAVPMTQLDALVEAMAEADPRGDVNAALRCPNCDHSWQAPFDVLSFFWDELGTWVWHMLNDVHVLASAYAWCEADILALSPWRRRYYLDLVRQ